MYQCKFLEPVHFRTLIGVSSIAWHGKKQSNTRDFADQWCIYILVASLKHILDHQNHSHFLAPVRVLGYSKPNIKSIENVFFYLKILFWFKCSMKLNFLYAFITMLFNQVSWIWTRTIQQKHHNLRRKGG